MVVMSFLLFFAFAVNTGLLVVAKISVQSAADAAAYAGAATQARQLDAISFLNYDMRRQYKKFLFRYIFIGALGDPDFPNSPVTPVGPGAVTKNVVDSNGNYTFPKYSYDNGSNAPTVAEMFNPVICIPLTHIPGAAGAHKNDNCLNANLANNGKTLADVFGPTATLNPIAQQVLNGIKKINATMQNVCSGQGIINLAVLVAWLFRGDNDITDFDTVLHDTIMASHQGLTDQQVKDSITVIESFVQNLGLYPRNILNYLRITTQKNMLNHHAEKAKYPFRGKSERVRK